MPLFHPTRRHVLTGAALGAVAVALPVPLSAWAQTPEAVLEDPPLDRAALERLGYAALEAARLAGAGFADLRLTTGLRLIWEPPPGAYGSFRENELRVAVGQPILLRAGQIGVRAWVDGQMGFAAMVLPQRADEAAGLARLAVARARALVTSGRCGADLAPVPVVADGHWQGPVSRDPFTVPFGEQEQLLLDALQLVRDTPTEVTQSMSLDMEWKRVDEMFLSSQGSRIWQRHHHANHIGSSRVRVTRDNFAFAMLRPQDRGGARGFEVLDGFAGDVARLVEMAQEIQSTPFREADPGSYPVVLGPNAVAQILMGTLGHPLEADRALGSATAAKSYAGSHAKGADALGDQQIGSPLLNIRADRTRPGLAATVGWDGEGVAAQDFTLVENGILVDYLTDRATAPELESAYARLGRPGGSRGCAADSGLLAPGIKLPNLALLPGDEALDAGALMQDIRRGYYIDDVYVSADHTGLNVQAACSHAREIRNGQLGDVLVNASLQFNTPRFWQSLEAVGGAASLRTNTYDFDDQSFDLFSHTGVSAPPVRLTRANVVNTGRRMRNLG